MTDWTPTDTSGSLDIAIIGLAGRFPGARNVEEFWRNLRDGVESITLYSDEELKAMGVGEAALANPAFVKAGSLIEGVDLFDAAFFNYSPKEAETLDPQHRLFLECAWGALESAGYNPERYDGLVGVYAGTSLSTYLLFNLLSSPRFTAPEETLQVMIGNDKDFLSTRVSYHLNLKGPSVDVQTGCSTSLVAIHLACQGLLNYHCDMALAGGISVHMPQRTGYYHQGGGATSPDGHCRAFDANAGGTIFGSGMGIVVLKRLADAIKDGDAIQAVVKGSAINNDGAFKIGYTAPSIDGQSQAITMAHAVAGVEADTISYIETHGTGTELGDPIEVAGLTKAFRQHTDDTQYCAIGSVKTNIGHLDAAAGVAGFIKTVLSLKHKMLPPSLHFQTPNPKIDFENSPFYVNAVLSEWKANGSPRRAGVSSFGIGGTNAHIVLEEAPPQVESDEPRQWNLLTFSAKSGEALAQSASNLAEYLKQNPLTNMSDVAYTLQVGRKAFNHRGILACSDAADAASALQEQDPQRLFTSYGEPEDLHIVFMFPGGGAQYAGMGFDLYRSQPVFREQVDLCSEILTEHIGFDLRELLYPDEQKLEQAAERLQRPSLALAALFTTEYSLAKLFMSWGVHPDAMIGHSMGEYVAACLAGVFSLEDALSVVVLRAALTETLPSGAMLSAAISEGEMRAIMPAGLSIAVVNGPSQCVVSGPAQAVDRMAELLAARDVPYKRLHIKGASHSDMVTPILGEFIEALKRVELDAPGIQFISNVTGTWVTAAEATDPNYWAKHLSQTVRFGDGIKELIKEPGRILLEVGPGQTLSTLARMQTDKLRDVVLSSMRHPLDKQSDEAFLLTTMGKVWLAGADIDLAALYRDERRQRIALPTYSFNRKRFWIEPRQKGDSDAHEFTGKTQDISRWFYLPSWRRAVLPAAAKSEVALEQQRAWLVFVDGQGLGDGIVKRLKEQNQNVTTVTPGEQFSCVRPGAYTINPQHGEDYSELLKELRNHEQVAGSIVHFWSLTFDGQQHGPEQFKQLQTAGYYSLLFLAQALAAQEPTEPVNLWVVSNGLFAVDGSNRLYPEKATMLGPCRVIPQEFEMITCRAVDVVLAEPGLPQSSKLAGQIMTELNARAPDRAIAYRGSQRWVQEYQHFQIESATEEPGALREKGVYLITGGLGGVGFHLAQYMADKVGARLVLTGRTRFPDRTEWANWLTTQGEENEQSKKIRKIMQMEAQGAEVLILEADAADEEQMRLAIERAISRFGSLHGIVHAAGLAGQQTVKFITELDRLESERHFQAKVYGSYILEKILRDKELDFCLLLSSNASILGGLGAGAYAAANAFMDAFAARCDGEQNTHWVSSNWDGWLFTEDARSAFETSLDQYAMKPGESVEAFKRVVSTPLVSQVVVSSGYLPARLDLWINRKNSESANGTDGEDSQSLHPRPTLQTEYVAWTNETEQAIVETWQEMLGIEQIGINDNFFDLGGNSLLGIKVIAQLKQKLSTDIPVVALFEGPTVKALAKLIARDATRAPVLDESLGRGARRRARFQKQTNA